MATFAWQGWSKGVKFAWRHLWMVPTWNLKVFVTIFFVLDYELSCFVVVMLLLWPATPNLCPVMVWEQKQEVHFYYWIGIFRTKTLLSIHCCFLCSCIDLYLLRTWETFSIPFSRQLKTLSVCTEYFLLFYCVKMVSSKPV